MEHATYVTFYEGKGATSGVRAHILPLATQPGFKIVNSWPNKSAPASQARREYVDGAAWMQRSHFCWVPPGQRYGDARRHVIAAFHGCIPVFTIPDGHHTLEEVLPWRTMALSVPQEQLPQLPQILRNVSAEERDAMRRELSCVWRRLWFSSIYGSCLGEETQTDALDALLQLLGRRLRRPAGGSGGSGGSGSDGAPLAAAWSPWPSACSA